MSLPLRAFSEPFRFLLPPFRGVVRLPFHCAHRTSTFLSCAFCEQEGHLAAPCPTFQRECSAPGFTMIGTFNLSGTMIVLVLGFSYNLNLRYSGVRVFVMSSCAWD